MNTRNTKRDRSKLIDDNLSIKSPTKRVRLADETENNDVAQWSDSNKVNRICSAILKVHIIILIDKIRFI